VASTLQAPSEKVRSATDKVRKTFEGWAAENKDKAKLLQQAHEAVSSVAEKTSWRLGDLVGSDPECWWAGFAGSFLHALLFVPLTALLVCTWSRCKARHKQRPLPFLATCACKACCRRWSAWACALLLVFGLTAVATIALTADGHERLRCAPAKGLVASIKRDANALFAHQRCWWGGAAAGEVVWTVGLTAALLCFCAYRACARGRRAAAGFLRGSARRCHWREFDSEAAHAASLEVVAARRNNAKQTPAAKDARERLEARREAWRQERAGSAGGAPDEASSNVAHIQLGALSALYGGGAADSTAKEAPDAAMLHKSKAKGSKSWKSAGAQVLSKSKSKSAQLPTLNNAALASYYGRSAHQTQ